MAETVRVTLLNIETVNEDALSLLTPSRREKAERLVLSKERQRSIAAGLLLRQVLHVENDDEIAYGPYGKPYFVHREEFFNLSHSGQYVVLAVAPFPVGVDIEQVGKLRPGIAARLFTQEESDWIGDDPARFYELWTRCESILKADGHGLAKMDSWHELLTAVPAWHTDTIPYRDYFISCAAQRDIRIELSVMDARTEQYKKDG